MPDPQVVYVVSAIVIVALVVWVIIVFLRAPKQPPALPAPGEVEHDKTISEAKT